MVDLSSRQMYTFLTRTKAFQGLVAWAFSVCDNDKTGEINKLELYAGILLVHVTLAKCSPCSQNILRESRHCGPNIFYRSHSRHSSPNNIFVRVILCSQHIALRF
jgi:hypothetical protein